MNIPYYTRTFLLSQYDSIFQKYNMRSKILFIVIVVSLYSCRTITIDNDKDIVDIPVSIELIMIPAGAYSSGGAGLEKYIEYDYSMMKYPVTNAQYIDFLIEADSLGLITIDSLGVYGLYCGDNFWPHGIYQFIDFSAKNSRIGYYPPDAYFTKWRYVSNRKEYYYNHPITHVTWYGAIAFAKFYGMRLPTIEEWEKAARANSGNDYPWGNIISSQFANYKNSGDEYDNDTTPVWYYNGLNNTNNSYSPYGVYDMAGNVWEWTSSWWRDSSGKVIKGGSFNSSLLQSNDSDKLISYDLLSWFEPAIGYLPTNISHEIGFRCVKDIEN